MMHQHGGLSAPEAYDDVFLYAKSQYSTVSLCSECEYPYIVFVIFDPVYPVLCMFPDGG